MNFENTPIINKNDKKDKNDKNYEQKLDINSEDNFLKQIIKKKEEIIKLNGIGEIEDFRIDL